MLFQFWMHFFQCWRNYWLFQSWMDGCFFSKSECINSRPLKNFGLISNRLPTPQKHSGCISNSIALWFLFPGLRPASSPWRHPSARPFPARPRPLTRNNTPPQRPARRAPAYPGWRATTLSARSACRPPRAPLEAPRRGRKTAAEPEPAGKPPSSSKGARPRLQKWRSKKKKNVASFSLARCLMRMRRLGAFQPRALCRRSARAPG